MKRISKIFIGLFVFIIVVFWAASVVVNLYGKRMVESTLSQALQKTVTVKGVQFLFPFGVRVDGIDVKDIGQIEKVVIQLAGGGPQKIVLSEVKVINPDIVITQRDLPKAQPFEVVPEITAVKDVLVFSNVKKYLSEDKGKTETKVKKQIIVKHLAVKNGQIQFKGFFPEKGWQPEAQKVSLTAHALSYPLQADETCFQVQGVVGGEDIPFLGSRVKGQGRVNFLKKDMDATLALIGNDGRVGLAADFKSIANDMVVTGSVKLAQMGRQSKMIDREESGAGVVFDALGAFGVDVGMNFSFKTEMDDFKVGAVAMKGTVGYGKDSSGNVKDELKSIGKQFEAFGKSLIREE